MEPLCELAGEGPAPELGIGTGRLTLPVVSRGVDVSGIDSSEAMVAKLRANPGGERVADIMGDFGVCLISWIRLASRRKQRLL